MKDSDFYSILIDTEGTYNLRSSKDDKETLCLPFTSPSPECNYELISTNPFVKKAVSPLIIELDPDYTFAGPTELEDFSVHRRTENILNYRSLLFEIDDFEIPDQLDFWNNCISNGFPISTVVFSGKYSFHALLVLAEPLNSLEEFRFLWDVLSEDLNQKFRLQFKLPDEVEAIDRGSRNPTICTRIPSGLRKDTGKVQTLAYCSRRYYLKEILDKIDPRILEAQYIKLSKKEALNKCLSRPTKLLSQKTKEFLVTFGRPGERNQSLCTAIAQMTFSGHTEDEILLLLLNSISENGLGYRYPESLIRSKVKSLRTNSLK